LQASVIKRLAMTIGIFGKMIKYADIPDSKNIARQLNAEHLIWFCVFRNKQLSIQKGVVR
jgi:hypothetical protein